MDSNMDISKIIGIIMENPDVIQKIKALAEQAEPASATEAETVPEASTEDSAPSVAVEEPTYEAAAAPKRIFGGDKKQRSTLLCALKPYISKNRAQAIDTMLSIMEVLDIMKAR